MYGLTAVDGDVIDETALVEEIEGRLGDDVDFYRGRRNGNGGTRSVLAERETVGQRSIVRTFGIGHEGDAAEGTTHIGDDRPLRRRGILTVPRVLCLDADIAVLW